MDLSPDLSIRARLVSVDVEDGQRHIGFAEGDEDEPYALLSQPTRGGPVRLELNDPLFAAEGAVARLDTGPDELRIGIDPALSPELGFARCVAIRRGCDPAEWEAALAALARMLPGR